MTEEREWRGNAVESRIHCDTVCEVDCNLAKEIEALLERSHDIGVRKACALVSEVMALDEEMFEGMLSAALHIQPARPLTEKELEHALAFAQEHGLMEDD